MSLAKVWSKIDELLEADLSLIPVRDKDDGSFLAKMPYSAWKQYQSRRATKDELWHGMETRDTSAVAIICGKISGYLEVIDVDVKFKPGVSATLFTAMQASFPDLFKRLRIHKTPSGGAHILYKVANPPAEFPGNQKLAGRMASEEELAEKPKSKQYNFIETRGEGGYVLAPPSMDYSVRQNVPIPLISWEDRCNLINVCRSLNEIVEYKPTYKKKSTDEQYYQESPWDDYNQRGDVIELLENHGWKATGRSGNRMYFTRPDKKNGVSASWNFDYQIFWVFTSSTEFEENKGYRAVDVLKLLRFNSDAKECYRWLVDNGYGKVKPNVEKQIIKRATVKKQTLPGNFSKEAKEEYQAKIVAQEVAHPHGKFWALNENEKMTIDREGLYAVAKGLGFALHNDEVVQTVGIFVHKRTKRYFFDQIKAYIREEDGDNYGEICNAYESFLQMSGKFTVERLPIFDTSDILKDDNNTAYKFYSNCFLEISKTGVKTYGYDLVADKLIWRDSVMDREWSDARPPTSKYEQYLELAVGVSDYVKKIVGYLTHDYKDENTGYIITLTEETPDPKLGGGSGKNIFGNLLRHTTTVCTVAGSQVQFSEKLLQSWNGERIFFMADVPKKFDYTYLKEISTGYGIVKKLYHDDRSVSPNDMPKLLVNTNYSFDAADGGLKRRIIPLEFTNFFTLCGGVDVHFGGCLFPAGWDTDDWAGFDHFVAESLVSYFKVDGKIVAKALSATGWEKQFRQHYSDLTYQFIDENMEEWIKSCFVSHIEFNRQYEAFCVENRVQKQYQLTNILMTKAITAFCENKGYHFVPQKQKRINLDLIRGKEFYADQVPF